MKETDEGPGCTTAAGSSPLVPSDLFSGSQSVLLGVVTMTVCLARSSLVSQQTCVVSSGALFSPPGLDSVQDQSTEQTPVSAGEKGSNRISSKKT